MAKPSITIVIPAFNEEGNMEGAVKTILDALDDRFSSYEIVIVNDASRDQTGRIADRLAAENNRIKAIHHQKNMGMGQSLFDGFNASTKGYIGSFTGDNALDGKALAEMFDLVGRADIISYYIANPEFRSWFRRFLSWLFIKILNTLFRMNLRYYNGHAIYRREIVQNIPHTTAGHAFLAESLIRLLKAGHTYIEIPAVQHKRKHGEDKSISLKNLVGVSKTILRLTWEMRGKSLP